jgi:hypothetical protein
MTSGGGVIRSPSLYSIRQIPDTALPECSLLNQILSC